MLKNTYVVVMAGGQGTRLWPWSRPTQPKHLIPLWKGSTLIQETVDMVEGLVDNEHLFIATVQGQLNEARNQLPQLEPENFIVEPFGRSTAACVGLAASIISRRSPDGVMIVLTADHILGPRKRVLTALRRAVNIAKTEGVLLTFGVKPRQASTSYGYIERGQATKDGGVRVWEVKSFKEKPDARKAKSFINSGRYFWNSGIFVWRVDVLLGELKRFLPRHYKAFCKVGPSLGTPAGSSALLKEYGLLPAISIDYGVLEKAKDVRVIEADFEWHDVGNWLALEKLYGTDAQANTVVGKHCGLDTSGCLIFGKEDHLVATLGVRDLVIVHSGDATLVCEKSRVEDIKALINRLKEKNLHQYI
ncbi:MAG: mannose-1-phosphate guanylyltransferase [Candidatus Brocadiales bacterium]